MSIRLRYTVRLLTDLVLPIVAASVLLSGEASRIGDKPAPPDTTTQTCSSEPCPCPPNKPQCR